jgi:hypothetical protein
MPIHSSIFRRPGMMLTEREFEILAMPRLRWPAVGLMWVAAGVVLWHPKSWPDVWVFSLAPVVFLAAVVAFILDRHLMKMRANILAAVEERSRGTVVEGQDSAEGTR